MVKKLNVIVPYVLSFSQSLSESSSNKSCLSRKRYTPLNNLRKSQPMPPLFHIQHTAIFVCSRATVQNNYTLFHQSKEDHTTSEHATVCTHTVCTHRVQLFCRLTCIQNAFFFQATTNAFLSLKVSTTHMTPGKKFTWSTPAYESPYGRHVHVAYSARVPQSIYSK